MKTDNELYTMAIKKWGVPAQMMMFYEEIGELMVAISKYERNQRNEKTEQVIIEEIADVRIMLEQLEVIIGCQERVAEARKNKLIRLEKRLEEVNNES